MKTPDEIKKGLECCTIPTFLCNDKEGCPYYKSHEPCMRTVPADALAYIRQLENDNKELEDENEELRHSCAKDYEHILQLQEVNHGLHTRVESQLDEIDDLDKEIEELRARVPRWISVEERLPERRGQRCLCICQYEKHIQAPGCTMILTWEGAGDNGYVNRPHFSSEGFCEMYVTHWMPLPEPPKEEE